jgi:hypothetical protein
MWFIFNKSLTEFYLAGKCQSGTLVEILLPNKKRHQMLIGDLNTFGEEANMFESYIPNYIVLRYKIIWSAPTKRA